MDRQIRNSMLGQYTKGAFTFVEILVVVVIISIASVLALPMLSGANETQARSAANLVMSDLEYARNLAITGGQTIVVRFDSNGESYQLEDSVGNLLDNPYHKGSDYDVDFSSDGRMDGVDISSVSFNGGSLVKFDYLGSPFDSMNSDLYSGSVTIVGGDRSFIVNVEPVTGYVSISD